tara:strand:- start:398 stop:829 length:432 start_codon:yes stop_codon:yes gene_type:complete
MAEEIRGAPLLELLHKFAQRSEYQLSATAFAAGATATVTVQPAQNTIIYLKCFSWDQCPPGIFDVSASESIGVVSHGPFRIHQPWIDHNMPNWEEDPPQVTNNVPARFTFTNQDSKPQVLQATIWWWEIPRQVAQNLGLLREL